MEWNISEDRPIFQQLYEQLCRRIAVGIYPPGEKIPPVRELAASAGVNPNTMQRALAQLESAGLAEANRTSGRTVTTDTERIEETRRTILGRAARIYLEEAAAFGFTAEDAAALLLSEGGKTDE